MKKRKRHRRKKKHTSEEELPGTPMQKWFVAVFGSLLFMGAGVALAGVPIYTNYQWGIQRSWVPAPCEITHAEVIHEEDSSSVDVRYTYTWEGRTYEGSHFSIPGGTHPDGPSTIVSRLSVGSTQTCYVNPHSPSDAVLYRGHLPWIMVPLMLFLGGGFFLSGMKLLFEMTEETKFLAAFRGITLYGVGSAFSCFVIVGFYLCVWVNPAFFGENAVHHSFYLMQLELLAIVLTLTFVGKLRLLSLGIFVLCGGGLALGFGEPLTFLGFVACRVWPVLRKRARVGAAFFSFLALTLTVFLAALLPFPPLGVPQNIQGPMFEGEGWQAALAWGCMYFTLLGIYELFSKGEEAQKESGKVLRD